MGARQRTLLGTAAYLLGGGMLLAGAGRYLIADDLAGVAVFAASGALAVAFGVAQLRRRGGKEG